MRGLTIPSQIPAEDLSEDELAELEAIFLQLDGDESARNSPKEPVVTTPPTPRVASGEGSVGPVGRAITSKRRFAPYEPRPTVSSGSAPPPTKVAPSVLPRPERLYLERHEGYPAVKMPPKPWPMEIEDQSALAYMTPFDPKDRNHHHWLGCRAAEKAYQERKFPGCSTQLFREYRKWELAILLPSQAPAEIWRWTKSEWADLPRSFKDSWSFVSMDARKHYKQLEDTFGRRRPR